MKPQMIALIAAIILFAVFSCLVMASPSDPVLEHLSMIQRRIMLHQTISDYDDALEHGSHPRTIRDMSNQVYKQMEWIYHEYKWDH